MGLCVGHVGGFDETFELLEVVEVRRLFGDGQQSDGARKTIDHLPLERLLQQRIEDRQHVVEGLDRPVPQLALEPLYILTRDPAA